MGGASPASAETYRVRAAVNDNPPPLYKWAPKESHIVKGDKIKWKNPATSAVNHNVKSYGNNWDYGKKTLSPGEAVTRQFNKTGTFKFRCTLHSDLNSGKCSGMCGKVLVHNPPS